MEKLINYGIEIINSPTEISKNKTVVVLGVARSGTSMVASVLNELGVFLGNKKDHAVFEDVEIANALEQNKIDVFKELVTKRNKDYNLWGWKRPSSFDHIDLINKHVRNPHFIIVFRDPLAISIRNKISMNSNVLDTIGQTQERYLKIIKFIQKTKHPCLLVSYEKAIAKKLKFIHSLSEFLTIKIDKNIALKASNCIGLEKAVYLTNTTTAKIIGSCHLTGTTIKGKVKFVFQPNNSVLLLVRINGKVMLEHEVNPLDNESFEINCQDYIHSNEYTKVELLEKSTLVHVKNSPLLVYNATKAERQNKIFFVHIPKTAGTSVRHALNQLFKPHQIFPNTNEIKLNNGHYPPLRSISNKSNDEITALRLFNGHYCSTEYRLLPFNFDIIVFFRNPLDRVVSNIKHLKAHDKRCRNMTFDEIYKNRLNSIHNLQLKYFANHLIVNQKLLIIDKNEFVEKINELLNHTKFIGITEFMEDSITVLNSTFDWNLVLSKSLNKTVIQESITKELTEKIESDCIKEKWLYEAALRIFNTRVKEENNT